MDNKTEEKRDDSKYEERLRTLEDNRLTLSAYLKAAAVVLAALGVSLAWLFQRVNTASEAAATAKEAAANAKSTVETAAASTIASINKAASEAVRQQAAELPRNVPVGTIVAYAGVPDSVPPEWLMCDGSEKDIRAFQELYAAIGNVWGGKKGFFFNLPDMRGRFLRGAKPDPNKQVQLATGGSAQITLSVANMPPHTHDLTHKLVRDEIEHHSNYNRTYVGLSGEGAHDAGIAKTTSSGDGKPLNIEPPFAEVFYIIKAR